MWLRVQNDNGTFKDRALVPCKICQAAKLGGGKSYFLAHNGAQEVSDSILEEHFKSSDNKFAHGKAWKWHFMGQPFFEVIQVHFLNLLVAKNVGESRYISNNLRVELMFFIYINCYF